MSWCDSCGISLLGIFEPQHRPDCSNFAREALASKTEARSAANPTVICSENVICYDVDDTLVMWDQTWQEGLPNTIPSDEYEYMRDSATLVVKCPYDGTPYRLQPHLPHIKLLKNHKARGKYIIVWSQGGYQWAEAIVKALGLQNYVDLIMSKPRSYVDDLPSNEWMKDRIYISPDSNWGSGLKEE